MLELFLNDPFFLLCAAGALGGIGLLLIRRL